MYEPPGEIARQQRQRSEQIVVSFFFDRAADRKDRHRVGFATGCVADLDRFGEEHFPECFTEYADLLTWDRKWDTILDTSNPPFWKWWVGGRLNACVNWLIEPP